MPCLTDEDGKIIVCLDKQEDIDRALVHSGQGKELLDNFEQLIRSMAKREVEPNDVQGTNHR